MRWLVALVVWFAPLAALAASPPAEGQVRETIPAAPFLAGAYGFIWVAVLVYVLFVARRLARVKDEIEDLRRRVERGA